MAQDDFNKVYEGEAKNDKVSCKYKVLLYIKKTIRLSFKSFFFRKYDKHFYFGKSMSKTIRKRQKRIAFNTCVRKTITASSMQKLFKFA